MVRGARHLACLARAVLLLTITLLLLLGCPPSVQARALSSSSSLLHQGKRVVPTQQPTQQPTLQPTAEALPLLSGHISRLYYRKTHPSTNCSQVNAASPDDGVEESYYFMDVTMYGVCLDLFISHFTYRTVTYITEVDASTATFRTVQFYHNDTANPNAHCEGPAIDNYTTYFSEFQSSSSETFNFYDNAADVEIVGNAADFVNGQSHFSRDTCFVYKVTIATQPPSLEPDNLLSLDFGVGQLERDGGTFTMYYSSKSLDDLGVANVGSLTLIEAFPLSKVVVYADNHTEVYECLNLYVEPVLVTSACHNNVGTKEGFTFCNSLLRTTNATQLNPSFDPITEQQRQALIENHDDNSRFFTSQTCVSVNTEQPVLYAITKFYAIDDMSCSGTPYLEKMESTSTCTPLQPKNGSQMVGSTTIRYYELIHGGFWRLSLFYGNSDCSGKALLDGGTEGLFRIAQTPLVTGCFDDVQTTLRYNWSLSKTLPSPSILGYQILQYLSPGACSSSTDTTKSAESQVISYSATKDGSCISVPNFNSGAKTTTVYKLTCNYIVVTRTDYPDNSASCSGPGTVRYSYPYTCNHVSLPVNNGGGNVYDLEYWQTTSCPESLSISLLLSAERVQYSLTIAFAVLSFLGSLFTLLMVLVVQVTDFSILLGAIAVCQAFYDVSFFEPFVPFLHRERNINLYAPVGSAAYNTHKWALFASLGFGNAVSLLTSAISLVVAYIIILQRRPVFGPLLKPLLGAVFVVSFVPVIVWVAMIDSEKGFIPTNTVQDKTDESSGLNNFIRVIPVITIAINVVCFAISLWKLGGIEKMQAKQPRPAAQTLAMRAIESARRSMRLSVKRRGTATADTSTKLGLLTPAKRDTKPLTKLLRRVILYPVIQAVTQLPSVVDTYRYQYITDDDFYKEASYRGFLFYYSVFVPSAGLWFALAFVIVTPGVWRKLTSLGVRARKGLVAALAPVLAALGVSVKAAPKRRRFRESTRKSESESQGQTADSSAVETGSEPESEPESSPESAPAYKEGDLADLDEQQLVDRHFSSLALDPAPSTATVSTSDADEGKVAMSPLHSTPGKDEGSCESEELEGKEKEGFVQVELAPRATQTTIVQTTEQTTTSGSDDDDLDLDSIYGSGHETGRFSSLQLSGRDGEAVSAIRQGDHVDDIPGRLSLSQAAQQHSSEDKK